MHIAVCDDNVAERKQLERLLGRESDRRKADTGVFYTDSYGDSKALMRNPMSYDLFFLDTAADETDVLAIARKLREAGVTAPIVLCSSETDCLSKTEPEKSAGFMYLTKPVATAELTALLDHAVSMQQNRVPTIELRSGKDTFYVREDDIVYALSEGVHVNVFLKNGNMLPISTTMDNFYNGISMYTHMLLLTEKSMINIVYLEKYSPFKVTLKDGTTVKSSPLSQKYIKSALQEYLAEQL